MLKSVALEVFENRGVLLAGALGAIPVFAIYLAFQRHLSKVGSRLQGVYSINSSVECDDQYVSSITIENLKDRAVSIYAIYLELRAGAYLLVESFDEFPLVLKPYETYQKSYDPVNFYGWSMVRYSVDEIIDARMKRRKLRLVAHTTFGRVPIDLPKKGWQPDASRLLNAYGICLIPIRNIFEEKCYGSNVDYLVRLNHNDGRREQLTIYSDNQFSDKFAHIEVPDECYESGQTLYTHLEGLREAGTLEVDSIEIVDLKSANEAKLKSYVDRDYKVADVSAFRVATEGRLLARLERWKVRRKNRAHRRRSRTVR